MEINRFLFWGMFGLSVEICFTAIFSLFTKKKINLIGHTSLWMFPIYSLGLTFGFDLIKQIMVFNLDVNEINFQENLINKIDSVLERTLKGNGENNFVQLEKRFPLEVSNNTYRGLWKMNQEFMGGPFLMKIQKKNEGEVIVSIGIVFAPGKPKKHFMIEMEALL